MRYFRIGSVDKIGTDFDGAFTWRLPSLRCPDCGHYRASRLGIPNLNIAGRLDEQAYRNPGQVGPDQFDRFYSPLLTLNDTGFPLRPGTGFGPFLGRISKREKRDFLWIWNIYLLLKETAYLQLEAAGLRFTTGPAVIESGRVAVVRTDYIRVAQIRPIPCMHRETLLHCESHHCRSCGTKVKTRPKKVYLEGARIPVDLDLFAPEEIEDVVVSERFRDTVQVSELTNISFEEVRTV